MTISPDGATLFIAGETSEQATDRAVIAMAIGRVRLNWDTLGP